MRFTGHMPFNHACSVQIVHEVYLYLNWDDSNRIDGGLEDVLISLPRIPTSVFLWVFKPGMLLVNCNSAPLARFESRCILYDRPPVSSSLASCGTLWSMDLLLPVRYLSRGPQAPLQKGQMYPPERRIVSPPWDSLCLRLSLLLLMAGGAIWIPSTVSLGLGMKLLRVR